MLSVLPHIWSSGKLHLCPLLAVAFTLAYICGCGYPDKPNLPQSTHLIHSSICKSTRGVLGVLGLQSITGMSYLRNCFTTCCGKTCLSFLNSCSQTFLVHYWTTKNKILLIQHFLPCVLSSCCPGMDPAPLNELFLFWTVMLFQKDAHRRLWPWKEFQQWCF